MGWLIAAIFSGVQVIAFLFAGTTALLDDPSDKYGFVAGLFMAAVLGKITFFFWKKFKNKEISRKSSEEKARLKKVAPIIISAIVFLALAGGLASQNEIESEKAVLINANQFAGLSPDELIGIMGKPERVDKANYTNPMGKKYPLNSYVYKNGDYEFQVIDNKVVSMNLYGSEETVIPYFNEKSIFKTFDIHPTDNMIQILVDSNTALRYESVTDKIEELWIPLIDKEKNKAEIVMIRYEKSYFGELPRIAMDTSEEAQLQTRCENGIKNLLNSPSTAKFPGGSKWYFAKDREKIIVQSYVDAQNGFGAEIRSEFQVTFSPSGDSLTSLIFDGKEYL